MKMEKSFEESPIKKITDSSVPYSDISGWVNDFRKDGLSDVQMMEMLKKLNVTNYQERKKAGNITSLVVSEEERGAWEATLESGGFSKEEARQIVGRLVYEEIAEEVPARKISIQHDEEAEEIPVVKINK